MRDITTDTFSEVLESEKPVFVEFWATWCNPCKMMAPVLESIAEENDWLDVVKVNADENPELTKRYDISSIPTMLLFHKGSIIKYVVGAKPKAFIKEIISGLE